MLTRRKKDRWPLLAVATTRAPGPTRPHRRPPFRLLLRSVRRSRSPTLTTPRACGSTARASTCTAPTRPSRAWTRPPSSGRRSLGRSFPTTRLPAASARSPGGRSSSTARRRASCSSTQTPTSPRRTSGTCRARPFPASSSSFSRPPPSPALSPSSTAPLLYIQVRGSSVGASSSGSRSATASSIRRAAWSSRRSSASWPAARPVHPCPQRGAAGCSWHRIPLNQPTRTSSTGVQRPRERRGPDALHSRERHGARALLLRATRDRGAAAARAAACGPQLPVRAGGGMHLAGPHGGARVRRRRGGAPLLHRQRAGPPCRAAAERVLRERVPLLRGGHHGGRAVRGRAGLRARAGEEGQVGRHERLPVADLMVLCGRPLFALARTYIVSDISHAEFKSVDFGWGAPVYGGPAKGGEGRLPGVTNYFSRSKNGKGEEGTMVPICLPKERAGARLVEWAYGGLAECRTRCSSRRGR